MIDYKTKEFNLEDIPVPETPLTVLSLEFNTLITGCKKWHPMVLPSLLFAISDLHPTQLILWDNEAIQLVQTWIPREKDTKEANLLFSYVREFVESGGLDEQEQQTGDKLRAQENLNSACSKFAINEESNTCVNVACSGSGKPVDVNTTFELLVDLTDHTGSLQSRNLSGNVAEKTLHC
ncbi:UNVERIFIED_CONTAM: hypothetical protein FKN15_024155 [Acipenser sinensis]